MKVSSFLDVFKPYLRYVWLLAVAAYLTVSAGRALQTTYQSQGELAALRSQLAQLEQDKVRYQALAIYYQTDAYKEKELRRSLLLAKPNERVYALPESSVTLSNEKASAVIASANKKRPGQSAAGRLESWKEFVFGNGER